MDGKNDRWLVLSLILLAIGIAANSILGPFIYGIVTYPFSESVRHMTIGLDAVSLIFVAPITVIAAGYVYRGEQVGYLVALSSSAYAMYTSIPQMI